MGVTVSRGIDNESMMDSLLETQLTLTWELERAMRLVDRGDYLERKDGIAYIDIACWSGTIHLSTPSIYITVIKHLDLRPGLRFLNIGSGTGYLNTIVGLILGYSGVNHGIEVEPYNVTFANDRLKTFLSESNAPLERDFCVPTFVRGNILDIVLPVDTEAGPVTAPHYPNGDEQPRSSDTQSTTSGLSTHGSADASVSADDGNSDDDDAGDGQMQEAADDDQEEEEEEEEEEAELVWDESIPIGPPPTCLSANRQPSLPGEGEGLKEFRWPTYDRVYVGAGIANRRHLQALLSLVKVDGIMIVPLEDYLIKLTRVSAQRTTCKRLSQVSYSPLVLPGGRGEALEPFSSSPPPGNPVPTLSQLTARHIRGRLCRTIERHHRGPPTIGRLRQVQPSEKAAEAAGDTVSNVGRFSFPPRDPRPSPLARILHHVQPYLLDRMSPQPEPVGSSTMEATGEDAVGSVEADSGCSVCSEHGNAEPGGQGLSRTDAVDEQHASSEPTTTDDTRGQDDREARLVDDSSGEQVMSSPSRHGNRDRQEPVYRYIAPNYRYRDEIRRILHDDMNLPEAYIRSVLRFD